MRIAHVLTYVSGDGSYGGPLTVAVAQCRALAQRGHEVTLLAGWDGSAELLIPGVDVRLHRVSRLPGLGFAGLMAPSLWQDLRRLAQRLDAVHFHFARDFVQLPAARLVVSRVTSVLQPHGMVLPDQRAIARGVDAIFTRPALRKASAVAVLTESEGQALATLSSLGRVVRIRNGVDLPQGRAVWRDPATILFLARLHPRKRPLEFVRMAAIVSRSKPGTEFVMVGADEGMGEAVRQEVLRLNLGNVLTYHGPVSPSSVGAIMRDAQVYVLPSVDEPFPMSVLEAMAHGLPTVVTTETGISAELERRSSAMVTQPQADDLADGVLALLNEGVWRSQSDAARADIDRHFSMAAVTDTLEKMYSE